MIFTLPQIIKQSAKLYPDKDAFRYGNTAITYGELSIKMNQLANLLISLGIKKGDRIGIFMGRSLETAIALYGISNAGAVFVPLDPQAPLSRTHFLINDCDIKCLITNSAQKRTLKSVLADPLSLKNIIGIEDNWPVESYSWTTVFENQSKEDPNINILEKDLAYIMYTSGTTGQPKGIMHTHYSGLSYAKLSKALYNVNPNDRVGNHSPLHFDISTFGYFTTPLASATTVIVSEAHTKMPASLSQLIEKEQLSIWYSVPLALTQLLHKGLLEEKNMTSLRWVLYGGEPFPPKHLKQLMGLWSQAQFSNVYGPAEVNQCTFYTIPKNFDETQSIPLGAIWDNTEMLILDQEDQIVKQGEQGELLIRSATMMQGYWKQKALSQKGFYKMEASAESPIEKIFYRTGDLVRQDENRNLLFMGRKDRQIKTRGYRVELDEIETALLRHAAIQSVGVFPVKDEEYGQLIGAAIVLKDQHKLEEKEIRNHLSNFLPWYAIPGQLFFLDEIPRTSAGKVNHKLLQKQSINLT